MPARVTILCGPARSGKTERLLVGYRAALAGRPPGAALWLAPTWRAANEIRQRILDGTLAGCFSPGVMTFEKFAEAVLHAAELPIRPITRLMKRELVRQIIAEQSARGRLKHFQPIAGTSGLVDLLCEFISELKRLEIWPDDFRQACHARGLAAKDAELSEIYDLYQNALREHGLFDAEGRFWSARDALLRGEGRESATSAFRPPPSALLSPLSLVVADGFTDFTRTQHEILELLAGRAEEMFVSLPLEAEPRRDDLFAKPLKTLGELSRRHRGARVEQLGRPAAADWPALARLERTVFENPRRRRRLAAAGTAASDALADVPSAAKRALHIEILAAAREVGEIEMIARRIKRLLVDGEAWPGEVAVVFRSPQATGELVDEVFGRLGIPVKQESGKTLDRSPALRALVALLQLDLDDWPFDRLLAVLGSNYFQPAWGGDTAVVDREIRQLQVPRGRETLLEELAAVGGDSCRRLKDDDAAGQSASAAASYRAATAVVKRLAAAFDALPQRATLPEWGVAWRRLAAETGLLRAMIDDREDREGERGREADKETSRVEAGDTPPLPLSPSPSLPFSAFDRRAWERLMTALGEDATLAAWLKRRPPELDRRRAVEALVDIIGSDRVGSSGDESGYVRVLSAESVRSLRIPYLFLAGLSEKAFPAANREDRLYSEAEQSWLIDAGLPLVARTERTREEMLLFYEAATRATKRLHFSYPALDETAQPLFPSPFLTEVEEAFGKDAIPRTEQKDLSPVPATDELFCPFDFRVKAVATAIAGNVNLLAGLMEKGGGGDGETGREKGRGFSLSPSSSLAAGLELIYQRQDRDGFGPTEGILQTAAARAAIGEKYPSQHTFSATDLERYASCPFRYFLERILRIEPLEDLSLEFDVMERGRIVHSVLAAFHEKVKARLGRPGSPLELDEAQFSSLIGAAIDASLPPDSEKSVKGALREVDRRLTTDWLSDYRAQIADYEKALGIPIHPELFEVPFGRADSPLPCVTDVFDLRAGEATVRISGKIDRIDTGLIAGRAVFNIIDYKTGQTTRPTPETVAAGLTLQLPIYALAAAELILKGRDARPWWAGYWRLRDGGFKPRQALKMGVDANGSIEETEDWKTICDQLGGVVLGLANSIRAGQFPVCSADEHCTGRCPFRTACRINQVRSLEKKWQPTAND